LERGQGRKVERENNGRKGREKQREFIRDRLRGRKLKERVKKIENIYGTEREKTKRKKQRGRERERKHPKREKERDNIYGTEKERGN